MPFEHCVKLPGSDTPHRPGLTVADGVGHSTEQMVQVSVILHHKQPVNPEAGLLLSHQDFAKRHGADPRDIELVEAYAHEQGLTVVEADAMKRRVVLRGTAEQLQQAFGAKLASYRAEDGSMYSGRTGALSVPQELAGSVMAVLGIDQRPIGKPHNRRKRQPAATGSFTPAQIAALYNFPQGLTGKGQTIGIIELGGGYKTTDLTTYFKNQGVKAPKVTAISVDGANNQPGSEADAEVLLDIEVAGAIAYEANLAVYFAPNTDAGFVDAVTNAVHDTARKPSVISISWGGPEDSWSEQSRNALNAAMQDAATLGVTITVASGDNGSSDGVTDKKAHVDFPASSPYALACGGTTLKGSGTTISSEAVWNETASQHGATGGGISNAFPVPAYQNSLNLPKQRDTGFAGRGVPDVAGNADPLTGYQVRVNGQDTVVGGTSAVAPLWAALVALFNQQNGKPLGFLNPRLYAATGGFHDITSGNNDDANLGVYQAQAGYDPCTGLGTPNGTALLQTLSAAANERIEVTGSRLQHPENTAWSSLPSTGGKAADGPTITASIVLRRMGEDTGDALLSGAEPALHHGNASVATAAAPEDLAAVEEFANQHGLRVVDANPTTRTVHVSGTAAQLAQAFGVELGMVRVGNQEHLTYRGAITMPAQISSRVTAVLGLDQRPVAKHHSVTA